MKKGNIFKTMISLALIACLLPMGSVSAQDGLTTSDPVDTVDENGNESSEKACYYQRRSGNSYYYQCDNDIDEITVRARSVSNVNIISVNGPWIENGLLRVEVEASKQDPEKDGQYMIILQSKDSGEVASDTFTIDGYVPDEPDPEPEEPDVPSTPTGNVFMITEGTKIPTIKVNEETVIEIPITRSERVANNEAQVSVKLPEGIYFTEIANIQNVEFERRNDYESYIEFKAMANSDVATGVYPITLTVKYKYDGQNLEDTLEFYVKVLGKGDVEDDEVNGKPRIIIDSYSFGGSQVMGGSPFTLSMNFKNTSTNVDIQNLKITVQSAADEETGGVFTPTASSNSFFVDNLAKNSAVTKSIVLMPRSDAKPKSYGVDISFEYEAMLNGELHEFSSTERISIPVVQSDRFEIGEVTTWGDFYVGEMSDIMVNYVNKGKTTINNLEITVESDMLNIPESTTYVGNVESGTSDMFSTSVTALTEGDVTGRVTFKYEDSNGSPVEVVKEFTGTAINMFVDPGTDVPVDPIPEVPEETGTPWWQWALIGVVAVAVIVGGAFFYKKKKKAKMEKEDAAFDDFDEA